MTPRTILIAAATLAFSTGIASAFELGLPVACALGENCFLQQSPDMDAGPGATDPFCGIATYDGHDGIDLRILSMKDVARGVAVVAAADGEVQRGRDGVPDHMVQTQADRTAVADKECGNGVIMRHQAGIETQYCHLKQGSIVVKPGQKLKAGDKIGEVGASGLAQFPHLHLTMRVGGKATDPLTGRPVGEGCIKDLSAAKPYFPAAIMEKLPHDRPDILGFGLAGAPVDYDRLAIDGAPALAKAGDQATVAWAWMSNIRAGDRFHLSIVSPDGSVLSDTTTDPVDRNKAVFSAFTGRKRPPVAGSYRIAIEVIRDGKPIVKRENDIRIE